MTFMAVWTLECPALATGSDSQLFDVRAWGLVVVGVQGVTW